jgi:nucleoredoxin
LYLSSKTLENWKRKYFGEFILNSKREMLSTDEVLFNKKFIAIYFGADWSPPCKSFKSELFDFYELSKDKININAFEVIYVSKDSDEKSFMSAVDNIPWFAIPFHNKQLIKVILY